MLRMRHVGLSVAGAALGVLTLGLGAASADPAPPGTYTPHPTGTLSVQGGDSGFGPAAANCTYFANKPNYSGSTITGTGGFSSCTGTVASCSSEVTLELYLSGPGQWTPAGASTRQFLCPPPIRSSTARVIDCKVQPTAYSYRVETVGSIVDANGQTDSGTLYGPTLSVRCL